jgi:hypothetical protein
MKQILFVLILVITFSGCKDKNKFSVDGTLTGTEEKTIYLNRLDVNTPVLIDSAKINKKGGFRFRINASEADFYLLGFTTENFITLLAEPGDKIRIISEGKNIFENYTIIGSPESEKLQMLDQTLTLTKIRLDSLKKVYTRASEEPDFDVKGPALEEEFSKTISEQRKKNIEFIINNLNSLTSIKALYQQINPETYVLYNTYDLQYLKIVKDSLTRKYPNSKHVQALVRDFDKEMNQMYLNQLEKSVADIPETKLDPQLKDINGRRVALSSLRGKYVLLTFWSVRSQECIEENLQLKNYYKLYKNKGFEIYQINLDQNEEDWKAAVKFDDLQWISTREDDPLNPKNAQLFNVKSLPANYLFDKEGNIIASNLHGRNLRLKLEQLFNK